MPPLKLDVFCPTAKSDGLKLLCGLDVEESVLIEAANNLAICAMYMCDLAPAVTTLEDLIREDPAAYMCDVVVFNLCTMYELTCENEATLRKKRVVQQARSTPFIQRLL